MNTNNNENNNGLEDHNLEQDKTEVFDEVDMASHLALGYAEQALKKHREMTAKKTPTPGFDGKTCFECGDDMHPVRLSMGAELCTFCQEEQERVQKILNKR